MQLRTKAATMAGVSAQRCPALDQAEPKLEQPMRAECHSTGVRKNYDPAHDRFATTWAEIGVGCEAYPGQGSRHVAWARERQSWWPFGKTEDPAMGLLVR